MARVWDLATTPAREAVWRTSALGRESRARLNTFRDRHAGQRCFIMGNGPSLRMMDLGQLANEITFGLNRIYLAFDYIGFVPSYYVAVNRLVIEQCAGEIAQVQAHKFISWACRDLLAPDPNVTFIPSRSRPHFSTNPVRGVWEGATVTYVALQLAYYMGFSQAVLIGVDHSFQTKGPAHREIVSKGPDPNHFHPDYFGKGFRWQLPDLERSERAYAMARRAFEAKGREVIDATVGGKLNVFRKVLFEKLFA